MSYTRFWKLWDQTNTLLVKPFTDENHRQVKRLQEKAQRELDLIRATKIVQRQAVEVPPKQ